MSLLSHGKTFFSPSIYLSKHTSLLGQIVLIAFLFSAPLLYLNIEKINKMSSEIQSVEEEQKGVELVRQVNLLLVGLYEHRHLMMQARLAIDDSLNERLERAALKVDTELNTLNQLVTSLYTADNPLNKALTEIIEDWNQQFRTKLIVQGGIQVMANYYDDIINATLDFKRQTALLTYLNHDSEKNIFYLIDFIMNQREAYMRALHLMNDYAALLLAKKVVGQDMYTMLDSLFSQSESRADKLSRAVESIASRFPENSDYLKLTEFVEQARRFQEYYYFQFIEKDHISIELAEFEAARKKQEQLGVLLTDAVWSYIQSEFSKRKVKKIQARNQAIALSVMLYFIVAYLVMGTYLHLRTLITDFNRQAKLLANGDFNVKIRSHTQTELKEVINAFNSMSDELKVNQGKLLDAEKMASLGTLVAGVSHEINTPLGNAITAATSLNSKIQEVKNHFDQGTITKSIMADYLAVNQSGYQLLNSNLETIKELMKSFKKMGIEQEADQLRKFELSGLLNKIAETHKEHLNQNRHFIMVHGEPLHMMGHTGIIEQIINQFIENSLLHGLSQPGGKIDIEISQTEDWVIIDYKDDGSGINEKDREKVFDPFFTTKRNEGRPGLGLNVVYNLVSQKLLGEISLEPSEVGVHFKVKIMKII